MDAILAGTLLASTLRVATPLILCALAGVLAERSGVIDLGLEGKMLFAAFAAAATGSLFGSTVVALLAGCGVAVLMSWLHGFATVSHRGDQVVSGMALNIIAYGLTAVLAIAWFQQGGQTPPLGDGVRLRPLWPEASATLGPVVGEGLFAHNALVYVALLLVAGVSFFLYRTRLGLRLRAVGENPNMVDAAGLSVSRLRYLALTLNGVLCGLAGAYLVLAQSAAFSPNMTAGRGYMALAAMIFGRWKPVPALAACLLFGFLDTIAVRLQGVKLPHLGELPVQAIQALPYLLTVVLLAAFIGRNVAPAALGRPYVKEH
ncbi:ABC transporter permease [Usitatibacter palustris]|uniref:Putative riboflavin import permease protein RfuD n=1 Tax=Usitatibacter palustris TaxID=2732487 RepID=A0A6M4H7C5_9PROT|nr:ABC transporter permease [Usitatibacter palustris]QJR15282.1 putative riboflavin import permease protein RfuD [Usitatibacter palustris]